MVLKRIPRILPPQLLSTLARMGHGDEIVLADANFPSASVAAATVDGLIRMESVSVPQALDAILKLLPLDTYAPPAAVMQVTPQDKAKGLTTPVWDEFRKVIAHHEGKELELEEVERFAFYERAKKAFAIVHTGETALYGNLILKKGVLTADQTE